MGMVSGHILTLDLKTRKNVSSRRKIVKKIFNLNNDSVYGHRLLGLINFRGSKLQQGVIHFKRALAQDPNDPDALLWLSVSYANVGRPNKAFHWMKEPYK